MGAERSGGWPGTTFRTDPLIGSGDGTFAKLWAADPSRPFPAQAAHSLYLETAAELGLVGLTLLLVALAVPFRTISVPASPVVAAAAGASAGYLLQAAFDWTWDVSGVTVAALACLAAVASSSSCGCRDVRPGSPPA